jgi:hypothetical protein
MVHQGIYPRVLRGTTYDPGHWTFYFCGRGFGLVVSVVVPLILAVLPYARGRGFDSRSSLQFEHVKNTIIPNSNCLTPFKRGCSPGGVETDSCKPLVRAHASYDNLCGSHLIKYADSGHVFGLANQNHNNKTATTTNKIQHRQKSDDHQCKLKMPPGIL